MIREGKEGEKGGALGRAESPVMVW